MMALSLAGVRVGATDGQPGKDRGEGTATLLALNARQMPTVNTGTPLAGGVNPNLPNSSGPALTAETQFLLADLQSSMNQLAPLLATLRGQNSATGGINGAGVNPMPASNNNQMQVLETGALLERVQRNVNELLPRLAAASGQANAGGGALTNSPLATTNFAAPLTNGFVQPLNGGIGGQPLNGSIGAPLTNGFVQPLNGGSVTASTNGFGATQTGGFIAPSTNGFAAPRNAMPSPTAPVPRRPF
jgi:hypothetical protein